MKIAVGGGTGFIGSALVSRLRARKDSVRVITRDAASATSALGQEVDWVTPAADPQAVLGGMDAVVNLAGEPIFGRRWTSAQKARIRASRVEGTRSLVAAMRTLPDAARPKTLVSGSAIGWYGPRGDQELLEDAPAGSDFLADVCREWEGAAAEAATFGVRVVMIRTGIVLGPGGGALARMLPIFKMGGGGPIGSGRQWMSWIHRTDLVSMILHALGTASLSGPLNGTAPNPVTNKEFAKTLGRVLRRPAVVPTPRLALRLAFGESADILATGQRVLPRKAQGSGFAFAFPDLEPALRDCVGRPGLPAARGAPVRHPGDPASQ
jgi:uncharacterized protein (TIGR01777 family)